MLCPKCDTEVVPGARFCGVCGAALSAAAGKGIVKAPPGAPTLAPSGQVQAAAGAPPPAARPRGKQAGMPKSASAAASSPLPTYLDRDPYLGAVLNERFRVIDKLGEGGFGAVYRGEQVGTGRQVALKLLHPEMTRDDNVVARFRREGEVLCQLRDAHTITTYDFAQTADGTLFIAMELLGGRSLHDVFKEEAPITWDRMLRLVAQMCTSLHEAHTLGIVHRDLKPENIYLENRPGTPEYVKILDFGIAKVLRGEGDASKPGGKAVAQLTATGQTLGTLEYMSPEQLMGKTLDGRSDIYAVGVLCYEMMTGQLPFPDAVGPAAQISAQLKKTPPRPSQVRPEMDIPAAVDELVLRCLGKRPADRFDDVSALRKRCDEVLEAHERATSEAGATAADSDEPQPQSPLATARTLPPDGRAASSPGTGERQGAGGALRPPSAAPRLQASGGTSTGASSSSTAALWLVLALLLAGGAGMGAYLYFFR